MKRPQALLLDIDGVLHVSGELIPGAVDALDALRRIVGPIRLVTNTSSRPRRAIHEQLVGLGFAVDVGEVVTPAALAVDHCRSQGWGSVRLLVADGLREDLTELEEVAPGDAPDAIVLADIGDRFDAPTLNAAFRELMDGAALVCLQHNRFWRSGEGLVMDVGAWSAALEYASGVDPVVVGKPSPLFFAAALSGTDVDPADALMVGDDVEADVGGGLGAGMPAILVRTGKFRPDAVARSGVTPTATIDSIADLPGLLSARSARR